MEDLDRRFGALEDGLRHARALWEALEEAAWGGSEEERWADVVAELTDWMETKQESLGRDLIAEEKGFQRELRGWME